MPLTRIENRLNELDAQQSLVHHLFERQVKKKPTAIAVEGRGQQWSYDTLNCRANQLAYYLRTQGVGPNVLVGLCLERSLDMVVSVLAILKAGGAYVPLDSSYPRDRLAYMLEQAQIDILLTHSCLRDRLPQPGPLTVCLDKEWKNLANAPTGDRQYPLSSSSLGYVIYTSGSTGNPKGVAMPHGPLVNLIRWQVNNSVVTTGKTLQFTPISFDVSFQEIFATLTAGGTVVLIEDAVRRDPYSLLKAIENQSIERLFLPFVALQQLAEVAVSVGAVPANLKEVITAGEQLRITPALVQWFGQMPTCTLWNQYGPSESHVVIAYQLSGKPSDWPTLPPIGKAIDNAEIYLLDENLLPVAQGDVGEIYIGGACLAKEYLHRPDLSTERFIEIARDTSVRLYKTGDLARCLASGDYEYLGRCDQQVKIRGYRIELGEIEAVLDQHICVKEAAVIALEDQPGVRRLLGYVVSNKQNDPDFAVELRQFMSDRLPDYMVPNQIICLDAFPLTPSGKIDRRNLPIPQQLSSDDCFVEPKTALEQQLASIWAKVLGLAQVGANQNFFDLGGHSLLATQIIIRIRKELEQNVPFQQLFEMPTIEELASWLSTQPKIDTAAPIALKPLPAKLKASLAWVQEPLWILDRLVPNHPFYSVPTALELSGHLDTQNLEKALQAIVNRHEALRTVFVIQNGKPVQIVQERGACPLTLIDLSALSEAERAIALKTQLVEAARVPFNLAEDVLLRATLFKLGANRHVLLLNLHHIVCDGWSVSLLLQELTAIYTAFIADHPSPLAPLPVQYSDFSLWHRQWLQPETCERQLTYWKTQLADGVPLLALPSDFSRPALPTYDGKRQFFKLAASLTQSLKALSRETGTTLYMTLLAAFQTLLYRYSGQDDIAVGSLLASRPHGDLEQLIGFFPNTVVLRSDLSGTPSFRQLLQRVKTITLGAYAHQDIPFDQLVQALHPDHKPGQNPFFQVLFNLQNTPNLDCALPELTLAPIELDNGTAKFDLFLELAEQPTGMSGYFEYSTDLFRAETIARMSQHFVNLLNAMVANPDCSIAALPLFSEAEWHQLATWNKNQANYPKHQCLHELIEAQVSQTPRAIALETASQCLTYESLNQRSNQCAHYLRSLGVGPGSLVGVFMDRSEHLLIALLAVLKAGGSYVPLDPIYPAQRLAFMVKDSQLLWVLTQSSLLSQLPDSAAQALCLDQMDSALAQQSSANPKPLASSEDVAYTIYTSGSTGNPKGVQIQHRALINFLWSMKQRPGLTAQDVWVAVTTICFDIAGLELYLPLLVGAKVVLASRETASDPRLLAALIDEAQATVMQATPATWRMLIAMGWQGSAQLNILCGGELLPRDLADQLLPRGKTLWNLYGPTETTIWSTVHQVEADGNSIPIGRPIANTQVYLLKSALRDGSQQLSPVPIGVIGELYIGGDSLAKGYLNRPALTQEKFIPNPFDPDPTARIYHTGDLARYLPDGTLECLGRVDHQVKIRGFRIELGDIEMALNQHPTVRSAVVVAREDRPQQKQLVAYVVTDENSNSKNPNSAGPQLAFHGKPQSLTNQQTQQWQTIWEQAYQQSVNPIDPTFDISGWGNSYTRQLMPAADMREWVDHTVGRILALRPQRLLEIGCGTGLLLYRVAPKCEYYRGIDLSSHAIETLQTHLNQTLQDTHLANSVQLCVGAADSLALEDFRAVDTVIMNSVVQYFPSIDYLFAVIAKACRGLASGGQIFVGDVRSLELLPPFYTAVQLFQAEEILPLEKLRAQIQSKLTQESELVISPQFFTALQQHLPEITQVDIQLKRGQYLNEMTQFRYDVVLYIGACKGAFSQRDTALPSAVSIKWQAEMDIETVQAQLTQMQPERLTLYQIDNARLLPTLKAMAALTAEQALIETVGDLRKYVRSQPSSSPGLDPEKLWQMGQALNYQVSIHWSDDIQAKTFDATFQKLSSLR